MQDPIEFGKKLPSDRHTAVLLGILSNGLSQINLIESVSKNVVTLGSGVGVDPIDVLGGVLQTK